MDISLIAGDWQQTHQYNSGWELEQWWRGASFTPVSFSIKEPNIITATFQDPDGEKKLEGRFQVKLNEGQYLIIEANMYGNSYETIAISFRSFPKFEMNSSAIVLYRHVGTGECGTIMFVKKTDNPTLNEHHLITDLSMWDPVCW